MAAPTSTSATITSANETRNCASNAEKEVDIYRDTPIRYLGYANEVGESFRALIPKSAVWATYGIASAYVLADARHKGQVAAKLNWPDDSTKKQKVMHAVGDTIVWQGLASVMIPGFTINRICKLSLFTLSRVSSLPEPVRKWTTTAIGLAVIPFIVKPIDKSVDYMMNNSVRRWYHIEPPEEELVHHRR
ncbi:mitochondrial fission process protein 1-like [Lytechinus variegatus]|uniref:mitochondrial fission process protein 1-like n=1 Tax=Lytechinus variegatus TaxID=7654 RepID=UPI001BB2ADAB|nr:mitochondrial fission process protein 1-like [Lytechinus variegatus]